MKTINGEWLGFYFNSVAKFKQSRIYFTDTIEHYNNKLQIAIETIITKQKNTAKPLSTEEQVRLKQCMDDIILAHTSNKETMIQLADELQREGKRLRNIYVAAKKSKEPYKYPI